MLSDYLVPSTRHSVHKHDAPDAPCFTWAASNAVPMAERMLDQFGDGEKMMEQDFMVRAEYRDTQRGDTQRHLHCYARIVFRLLFVTNEQGKLVVTGDLQVRVGQVFVPILAVNWNRLLHVSNMPNSFNDAAMLIAALHPVVDAYISEFITERE